VDAAEHASLEPLRIARRSAEEASDARLVIDVDRAVALGLCVGADGEGRERASAKVHRVEGGEVDVAERVTVHDREGAALEMGASPEDASAGVEDRILGRVADSDPERAPVAERGANRLLAEAPA
jgi:hypothetical protein